MKYLLMSDLHGSASSMKKLLKIYEKERCNAIICLGDLLYHGPRNPFPEEYAPMEIVSLLKPYLNRFIWVQGNCDSEVDEMVMGISFHKKKTIHFKKRDLLLTHGHQISAQNPGKTLKKGTIVLYGHYHKHEKTTIDSITYLNLGSPSLPKDDIPQYGILTNEGIYIYDLNTSSILESIILED